MKKTLSFSNTIFIKKLDKDTNSREVKLGMLFQQEDVLFKDINHFGYVATLNILKHLKNVLDGNFKNEYEWAGMRTSFESGQEITIIKDLTAYGDVIETKTSMIYKLMEQRAVLMTSFREDDIKEKVKKGFERIIKEPEKYQRQNYWFVIPEDKIELNFFLLPSDLELGLEDFMASVFVNKLFLQSK